ncbi:DUF3575 domain-containing protein [Nafulsella turpanensis]|uniref:DUF3575 domain-containing protein n=1 Tax=Nafulsella turpanensis TaxID=1265690 RepID=UPI00034CE5F7|nr:DUF3575 domain-containing protein [Nafulsella turpanensis]
MKRILAVAFLLGCGIFMSGELQAQVRSNVVKFNPLSLAVGTFNFSYERVLNDSKAVQLGVYFTSIGTDALKYSGYGITPEYRLYLSESKGAPEGWHVTPFLRYSSFNLSTSAEGMEESATMTTFGGGVVAGHQWLFGQSDRVTLDMYIGPKYDKASFKYEGSAGEEDFDLNGGLSGFWIRGGLTLGVAF